MHLKLLMIFFEYQMDWHSIHFFDVLVYSDIFVDPQNYIILVSILRKLELEYSTQLMNPDKTKF